MERRNREKKTKIKIDVCLVFFVCRWYILYERNERETNKTNKSNQIKQKQKKIYFKFLQTWLTLQEHFSLGAMNTGHSAHARIEG